MRTQEEREAEAERNRRRLLQAEAAAVALLLSHRKQAVSFGLNRGFSVPRIGQRIEQQVSTGITQSRILSRTAGISQIGEELDSLGIDLAPVSSLAHEVRGDLVRAQRYANNYARQWVKKAEGDTVAKAVKAANASTLGSLTRTAVTESSQAFGDGRAKALDGLPVYEGRPDGSAAHKSRSLLKVWDAQLDKRTCPTCSAADGTIVGIKESFPQGTPGAIHPWDRCTWRVLTFEERGTEGYIEPKEPAKVISLPTPARASAPVAPSAAAPPKPVAVPTKAPQTPQPGYLLEHRNNPQRALAYERMLASRVVPEVLRQRRLGAGFRRATSGLDEAKLVFLRTGYRPAITPYAGVFGQAAINDIATGRVAPPGSFKPLPPIRLGISGKNIELIDGRHRMEAAQLAGATEIRAKIMQYDRELNVVWEGERVIPLPKPDPKNPHHRGQ